MQKHVTPADARASIPDPVRGDMLPAEGRSVAWTPYWAGMAARDEVRVSEPLVDEPRVDQAAADPAETPPEEALAASAESRLAETQPDPAPVAPESNSRRRG